MNDMAVDAIQVVRDWHDAVNAGDAGRLAGIVTDDVEVGGPRGSAYGRDALIDWVERTGIRMEPTDWYQRGEMVIVCQRASWPAEDGTPGVPQKVASIFTFRNGQIAAVARYGDLVTAFREAGLTESDRVYVE
jgi:ketosteroid isomerase-like protein